MVLALWKNASFSKKIGNGKLFLGGGFKYCLCSSLFGEDSHFDEHIFQMGWFNHQPALANEEACCFIRDRLHILKTLTGTNSIDQLDQYLKILNVDFYMCD